jgi:transcriptional regulator GlxA family with amidase domain
VGGKALRRHKRLREGDVDTNTTIQSSMKNVSILIPEGDISLVNVEGLQHIFSETNKALKREGKDPLFYFQLIGKKRSTFLKDFFSIHPNFLIDENVKTDILIIPALHGDIQKAVEINRDLLPWIIEQRNKGAEIISLCTGAFLLAATGLLNGKRCATHWIHASEFREMFPAVNLVGDQIMTDENGIYSSGAAYSYLNLILYVLEKYVRHETVVFIAKIFAIDMGRNNQSQFMIFQGYKNHGDDYILKAQEYIERSYQQKITVQQLADHVFLGRRNLERRFKIATAHSVTEYIQRVKIEAAKKQLEAGKKIVNEVIYDVGYTDVKSFRDLFKKIVGMSPIEYRSKYNMEISKMEDYSLWPAK